MTLLERYRILVPGHSAVLNPTVQAWLDLAESRHTRSAWGAVYDSAMVFWAAHGIEVTPGTGAGSSDASAVGPVISQRDGDLSRTYAAPALSSGSTADGSLGSTRYGQQYLDLRNSRVATAPFFVSA